MSAREAAADRDRAARRRLADDPVYQIKQRRQPGEGPTREDVWDRKRSVGLTTVERRVLQLVAEGYSNPEIAARLRRSVNTIKTDMQAIFRRLDAVDRANAVAIALRRGEIL